MIDNKSQYRQHAAETVFIVGWVLATISILPLSSIGFALPKLLVLSVMGVLLILLMTKELAGAITGLFHTLPGQIALAFFTLVPLTLAWSIMPVISFLGSPPRFEGVIAYGAYAVLFLTGYAFMVTKHGKGVLIRTILLSNAIITAYGFLQVSGLDPFVPFWNVDDFLGRTFSFIGQPNTLAIFLVLTLPFVLIRALLTTGQRKIVSCVLLALNIAVLLSTASRGGLLGLVVVAIGMIGVYRHEVVPYIKHRTTPTKVFMVAAIILLVITGGLAFSQRFAAEGGFARSMKARVLIWQETISMITDRPLGYGLEAMGVLHPQYKPAELNQVEPLSVTVDRPHNKPLELLVTLGPLGLITYYGLIFGLLVISWRKHRTGFGSAAGVGIAGYSAALLFGFDSLFTAATFWLIAGALIAMEPGKQTFKLPRWFRRSILAILLALCIAGTAVAMLWINQRINLDRAATMLLLNAPEQSAEFTRAAVTAFPADREVLIKFTEANLFAAEETEDVVQRRRSLRSANNGIASLERLTNGYDHNSFLLKAWLAALEGDARVARVNISGALRSMPTTADAYRVVAHAYELLGDREAALNAYQQLIAFLPKGWDDPTSEVGRIIRKENPWLEMVENALEEPIEVTQ